MSAEITLTWICEGCDYTSTGETDYQHQQDATRHWEGLGYPHVVRPVRLGGTE